MQAIDDALLRAMVRTYESSPVLWTVARWLTEAGGGVFVCTVTALVALWLLSRGERRRATALVAITFAGRLIVETLKWWTDRPRPRLFDHPVAVHSLSFPSGHAANSTIVYLSLALIAAPLLFRSRWPVAAASMLATGIGLSRLILGVHWPSDILAGWALGLGWTLSTVWLLSGWMEGQPVSRPPQTG